MNTYKRPDWKLLDSYYVAGRALASEFVAPEQLDYEC